jgi:hypothetical protein
VGTVRRRENDLNNLFAGGYKEVFVGDLYEAWTALYTDGDISTAQATVRYLPLKSQQANGSQPRTHSRRHLGAADAFNDQPDGFMTDPDGAAVRPVVIRCSGCM